MMEQLVWTTEKRKVNDLIPYEHNPRQMTAPQMRKMEESLKKFGFVEIPAINQDGILIAGHQRCKAMQLLGRGDELVDVRVPNRQLTELELKEYNIASNAIKGDWLDDVLREHFQDIDLMDYGLELAELDELLADSPKAQKDDPVFPIVAEFSEKHEAFIIISNNEIDSNFIKQVLQLGQEQSYKSQNVGQSHVITAKAFTEIWNSKSLS